MALAPTARRNAARQAGDAPDTAGWRAWQMNKSTSRVYLLILMMAVVCVHGADRMGFSIVLDSIKSAMALNDTQLGLLAGPAFAVLNAGAAIPLAWLADRFGGRIVLTVCVTLWSSLTAVSGLTTGFAGLATARAGIGFADAAASPVSQSLVSAAYMPSRRAGALAWLVAASYAGTTIGFALAGVLCHWLGWRAALVWMSVPGIVVAATIWLTLAEPPAVSQPGRAADHAPGAGPAGWLTVIRQGAFLDAAMVEASAAILGWAAVAWLPAFLARSYGMGSAEIGFWLAGVIGAGGAVGVAAGGALANRLNARRPQYGLWLGFWTTLASAPLLTMAFVSHDKIITMSCILASAISGAMCMGPVYATVQDLAEPHMRATIAAVFGVVNILLGQAGGPLLVGAMSDIAAHYYGRESLRLSLEVVSLLGVWPAFHLYRLASRVPRLGQAAAAVTARDEKVRQ